MSAWPCSLLSSGNEMPAAYRKPCPINQPSCRRYLADLRDEGVRLAKELSLSIAGLRSLHLPEQDDAVVAEAIGDMRRLLDWTDEVIKLLDGLLVEADRAGCAI